MARKTIKKAAKKVTKKPAAKKPVAKKPTAKKAAPKKAAKKAAPKKVGKKVVAKKPLKKVIAKKAAPKKVAKKVAPKKAAPKKIKPVAQKPMAKATAPKTITPKVKKGAKNAPTKTRYSEDELRFFKNLIDNKLAESRTELKYYQEQISNANEGADSSDTKIMTMEDGSATNEKEYITQMMSRKIQHINNLENALMRIQNRTYGVCRVTGKLISKERLIAVPHATTSMEGKRLEQK